jgi:L-serine deaminase
VSEYAWSVENERGGEVSKCTTCGAAGAIPVEVWDASGQRTCDYNEWKETRALCETCCDRYTVCEGCGVLISDNVWITGRAILCPDCKAQGQADKPAAQGKGEG